MFEARRVSSSCFPGTALIKATRLRHLNHGRREDGRLPHLRFAGLVWAVRERSKIYFFGAGRKSGCGIDAGFGRPVVMGTFPVPGLW